MISPCFTKATQSAWYAGLDSDAISYGQRLDRGADGVDRAGSFVAHHDARSRVDMFPYAAVVVEVYLYGSSDREWSGRCDASRDLEEKRQKHRWCMS